MSEPFWMGEEIATTSGFSSRLAGSIALLAIRAGIEDFGDFDGRN
ncbi:MULTISPECIES: hypothetical protein [unclassified Microcoleus]|nr:MULTISPECIES: hypothetical protein [unclassified Microcoleus]